MESCYILRVKAEDCFGYQKTQTVKKKVVFQSREIEAVLKNALADWKVAASSFRIFW